MQHVRFWPNGTWCFDYELHMMTHMSDDCASAQFSEEFTEEDIDAAVLNYCKSISAELAQW